MKQLRILSLMLFFLLPTLGMSQNFPVQSTVQVLPPNPLTLAGYSDLSTNGIQATLLLKEAGRIQYPVKLRITIEGQEIFIQTKSTYSPPPLYLDGGLPFTLLGADLADYLNPRNLNISGSGAQRAIRGGTLPEGLYTFSVEVLDFNRGVVVSNLGQARAWLVLNDPPILNQPANGKKLKSQEPQNIVFQWTPRHTGSPNAAFNVKYEFQLFEILPKGRNPNDIALTTEPIHRSESMSPIMIYGPGEPQLFPGQDYAWRVRAIDESGAGGQATDLFKNDGYSEVYQFTYGDACKAPDNITATAVSHNLIRINWNQGIDQDSYIARIKKANDNDAAWFEYPSNTGEVEISWLEAETDYLYQVLGVCFGINSTPTEAKIIKTLKLEQFSCGDGEGAGIPFIPFSEISADYLGYGSVIKANNFEVFVTSARKEGDTFTGTGLVELPFLKSMRVGAEFYNIRVNKEYQLTEGTIVTTHKPVESILDIDSVINDLGSDPDVVADIKGQTGADTVVVIAGNIEDVYVDDDNNIVVIVDGEEQVIGPVGSDSNGDGIPDKIAVVDEDGDTYTVDAGGNVNNAGNFGSPFGGNAGGDAPPVPGGGENRFDILASFKKSTNQKFGFDGPDNPNMIHYEKAVIGSEENYKVAWKSVVSGQQDNFLSNYEKTANDNFEVVYQKEGGSAITHQVNTGEGNTKEDQLTISGTSHEQVDRIYAMAKSTVEGDDYEEAIGKINLISYDEEPISITLVKVNGDNTNLPNLQNELNEIFGQAAVKINSVTTLDLEVPDWDKGDNPDGKFDDVTVGGKRSGEMDAVRKALKKEHGRDKHTYYVFLIPHQPFTADKAGIMRRASQYAYIFTERQGNEQIVKTIAHELGHGVFNLQHTFQENPSLTKGSTDNLMDYKVGGRNLRKNQWDAIHNPEWVVGLFEDDQESSLVGEDVTAEIEDGMRSLSNDLDETGVCWLDAVKRGKKVYGWSDDDRYAGLAYYAGLIEYILCETSYEEVKHLEPKERFTVGLTNALLQEIDFVAFVEAVDNVDIDFIEIIQCTGDNMIGARKEDNAKILFKCFTGIEMDDFFNGIEDFIVKNWDEPYYQGQATVFALSLVSPLKAALLRKISKLPKMLKHFRKFEKLSGGNSIDEIVAISRRLDGNILNLADDAVELTPKIRTALNSLEGTTDGRKYLDIIVHGEGNKFIIDGTPYDVGELADIIKQVNTDNLDVRLLSCSDLESAKEVAKQLDGKLIANDGITRIHSDGKVSAVSKTDGSAVEWQEIDSNGDITGSVGKHTPESVNDDFVELGKKSDGNSNIDELSEAIANGSRDDGTLTKALNDANFSKCADAVEQVRKKAYRKNNLNKLSNDTKIPNAVDDYTRTLNGVTYKKGANESWEVFFKRLEEKGVTNIFESHHIFPIDLFKREAFRKWYEQVGYEWFSINGEKNLDNLIMLEKKLKDKGGVHSRHDGYTNEIGNYFDTQWKLIKEGDNSLDDFDVADLLDEKVQKLTKNLKKSLLENSVRNNIEIATYWNIVDFNTLTK